MILIVEDDLIHFEDLRRYLDLVFPSDHQIARVQSAVEVERAIDDCRKDGTSLILIVDLFMDLAGLPHYLTPYVKDLWERKNDEWLARVPIVIWSAHTDRLPRLPARARSRVVSQVSSTGVDDLEELNGALEAAIA